MTLPQEESKITGSAYRVRFDERGEIWLQEWFRPGTTMEEIALAQEGTMPSVGFLQHNEGWWEIRDWSGKPVLGLFIPDEMIPDWEHLRQLYA